MQITFYDPHPGGVHGCTAPLPEAVEEVAHRLDGMTRDASELPEVMRLIQLAADQGAEVRDHGDYLGLRVEPFEVRPGFVIHRYNWRMIRYREAD